MQILILSLNIFQITGLLLWNRMRNTKQVYSHLFYWSFLLDGTYGKTIFLLSLVKNLCSTDQGSCYKVYIHSTYKYNKLAA